MMDDITRVTTETEVNVANKYMNTGETDDGLITELCNYPTGCFV